MHFQMKSVTRGVKVALYTGIFMSGFTFNALAADDDPAKLDKVEVTGSHIKQIDIKEASPIAVISREDIELSGLQSVAEVLRRTPYNSFGSYRETSGNTFQSQALVDMRGLGAGRTLVLLNGHRMPTSPVTGNWAVDLNILPLAAVDRIEILKDSASAVYGSEAIGGVINVILRKDYEGTEFSATAERPNLDGGDAESASFVTGGTHAKGNYIASMEWRHKDIIFSRDRDWSDTDRGDGSDWFTTENMSINGNTWEDPDTGIWYAGSPCDEPFAGVYDFSLIGWEDTVCMFPYADIAAETNELTRANAFLHLDYEINEETTMYVQNVISRVEGFGRYAPALGMFAVSADNPVNPYGKDMFLRHRFVAAGPRDDTSTNWQWDALFGVEGTFSDIDYDVYARYNLYNSDIIGRNYILQSEAETQVDSGNYDPFNPNSTDQAHLDALAMMVHDTSRDIQNDYFAAGFNLTGELPFELQGGNVSWAAGYEYRDESYQDLYDAERRAGNVLGSSGGSSEGERDQYAIYGEVLLPVMDDLELTGAVRFDKYSDFGSEVSPQIKARWQPLDNLMVRASWGEGFRAPTLRDLYLPEAFSAEFVIDYVWCEANGIAVDDCPTGQEDTYFGGNPDLEAESSESYNLGVVFEPIDDLVLELDMYNIELTNVIGEISPQNLINLEYEGSSLPSGTNITRTGSGRIDRIDSVTANIATREVKGADLSVGYTYDLGDWGTLKPKLTYTYMKEYLFQPTPLDETVDIAGSWSGGPDKRAQFSMAWDINDFRIGWLTDYIGDMDAVGDQRVKSYTESTLTVSYNTAWDGQITFGARNVFDNEPPIDTNIGDASDFYYLYPIDGRVLSLTYSQSF